MGYYENKKAAFVDIEIIIAANPGKTIDFNYFLTKFMRLYGMGNKATLTLLKLFEVNGFIRIEGEKVIIYGSEKAKPKAD